MIHIYILPWIKKISLQDLSLKELTGYEWNLLADSAAFSRIDEYVYGVTLRVEGRQCSKAVRRL